MKLLPIGSVVELKKSEKRLMICGVMMRNSQTGETFDYIGCLYPEGYINNENMFLFNNADIEKVHFIGFTDAEAQVFRVKLANELQKENTSTN